MGGKDTATYDFGIMADPLVHCIQLEPLRHQYSEIFRLLCIMIW